MKKIGILGSGIVGETLANGFLRHGYAVMRGSREPMKMETWKNGAGVNARTGSFEEAASFGDLVVLAVKGVASETVIKACNAAITGKTVIDATNPIDDKPPTKGVLHFFTSTEESLMERLQKRAPKANFVKAFSCVGNAFMVNPNFGGTKPTMFICGNNPAAKSQVREILDQFGWEIEDVGEVESARAIEPLCILWCLPGMRENRWNHAFKLLKA